MSVDRLNEPAYLGQLEASALVELVAFAALCARRFVRQQPQDPAIAAALHEWTAQAREWSLTIGIAAAERQPVLRAAQLFLDQVTCSADRRSDPGTAWLKPSPFVRPHDIAASNARQS